jgi:hypothetical protein
MFIILLTDPFDLPLGRRVLMLAAPGMKTVVQVAALRQGCLAGHS